MRMCDGPRMEVTTEIAAPPPAVWAVISDVTGVGGWGGECVGAEWLDGGGPEVGARFRGRQRREGNEWETVSVVTAAEPGASFGWAVGDPANPGASWRFDLTPAGDGTEVRYSVLIGPGPSGLTSVIESMPEKEEKIISFRLEEHRRNMTGTLEAIKRAAEG